MATIVLGAVGRAFAGPVGGLLGSVAGGFVDRALFGGGRARDIGRLDNPAVQSAAYGEAIPVIVGRMRAAGNLIWCSGIREQVARGGGKSGPASNQYSYFSSFAVGLAARRIVDVGRIWADSRLVRDADGAFLLPMVMRLHKGLEEQPVDPLIAAAEGAGQTPAYHGLAYAVFEDLALAEFGNRIPNLTFEILADEEAIDIGDAARALVGDGTLMQAGDGFVTEGQFPAVSGYYFGRPGSVAESLAGLVEVIDGAVQVTAGGIRLVETAGGLPSHVLDVAQGESQARSDVQDRTRDRQSYAGDAGPDIVELGFYDVGRDYQAGLQRSRRGRGSRLRQDILPAAMTADQAKGLVMRLLARGQASRLTRTVSLPWRELGIQPGMLVKLSDSLHDWRVRELRFEGFVMSLRLERLAGAGTAVTRGDGGRVLSFDDAVSGPTQLHLMELPGLGHGVPVGPVVLLAGAGASSGWRRGGFETSSDLGVSYGAGGVLPAPTVMGRVVAPLADGPADVWDMHNVIDVDLLGTHMWLEGRSEAAVLQGANVALIGDELVQFRDVEAIGAGRFRLRHLLRGRRGTEYAMAGHGADERFVLLDGSGSVSLDAGVEAVGQSLLARPVGPFDQGVEPEHLVVRGTALRPLAPAHVRLVQDGGDVVVRWIRRSRAGFAWLDFVEAPLAEAQEAYQLRIFLDGLLKRVVDVAQDSYRYTAAARFADGDGAIVTIEVVQMSQTIGPGYPASASLVLY